MKKYSLLSLYNESAKILESAGINVTTESKLDISCDLIKKHNTDIEKENESNFYIQFYRDETDKDYIFCHGFSPIEVIEKLKHKVGFVSVSKINDINL